MARTDQLLDVLLNLQKSQHPSGATTGCLPVSLQLSLSLSPFHSPFYLQLNYLCSAVKLLSCSPFCHSISLCCLSFCPSFSHRRGGGVRGGGADLRFT